MPKRGEWTVSLPLDLWPEIDRQLFEAAFRQGDLLDAAGAGCHLREESRNKIRHGYGVWLAFLRRQGLLNSEVEPAARVNAAALQPFIDERRQSVAMSSVLCDLGDLTSALRLMQPGTDLRMLRRALSRARALAVPVRPIQPRLVPPRELFAAGLAQMQRADTTPRACVRYRAGAYRDGLAVAMLAACPLRRRSFTNLRLNQHLRFHNGKMSLYLEPEDLKAGRPISFPLPSVIVPNVLRYLETFRPVLLAGRSDDALWTNAQGAPISEMGMAERISVVTARHLGRAMPMHLFRHAAATGMAIDDPHHVQLIAALLGHSTLTTAERYYNMASSLEAGRQYQNTMRRLGKGAPQRILLAS